MFLLVIVLFLCFDWDLSTKFHSFMYSVYGMTIKKILESLNAIPDHNKVQADVYFNL